MGRLIAQTGFAGSVGGTVTVYGTTGAQTVTVLDVPGDVTFDASFNRGGNVIVFTKAASEYQIVRSGSSVVISDNDSRIAIPIGAVANTLQFTDGDRALRFDGGIKVGDQLVDATAKTIAAAGSEKSALPQDTSASASRLVLSNETVSVGGKINVFGSVGSETVNVVGLANTITFDASFNRGGDKVNLNNLPETYTAKMSGSTAVLSDGNTTVNVPIGAKGLHVGFTSQERLLVYTDGNARLGNQIISATEAPIIKQKGTLNLTMVSSIPLNMMQSGMGEDFEILDIDQDGKDEIILFPANMREPNVLFKDIISFSIYSNAIVDLGYIPNSKGTNINSEWVQDSAVSDFNNDGLLDLIFAGSGSEPPDDLNQKGENINLLIMSEYEIHQYEVNKFFVESGFWHSLSVGNINRDSIVDIAVVRLGQSHPSLDHNGAFFLIGNGDGTFRLGDVPASMTPYLNVGALIDVNSDGLDDYFWGTMWDPNGDHANPRVNRIYINEDGHFSEQYLEVPFLKETNGRDPYHIATDKVKVGDFDQDGLSDLLIMYADYVDDNGRWLQLLRNNGDGTFDDIEYFNGFFSPRLSDGFEFFDINSDGLLDIYQTIQFGGSFLDALDYTFINMGESGFAKFSELYEINTQGFDSQLHSSYFRFFKYEGGVYAVDIKAYDWVSNDDYKVSMNLYTIS